LIDPERMGDLDLMIYYAPSTEEAFQQEVRNIVDNVRLRLEDKYSRQTLITGSQDVIFSEQGANYRISLARGDRKEGVGDPDGFWIDLMFRNPKHHADGEIKSLFGGFNPLSPHFVTSGAQGAKEPLGAVTRRGAFNVRVIGCVMIFADGE